MVPRRNHERCSSLAIMASPKSEIPKPTVVNATTEKMNHFFKRKKLEQKKINFLILKFIGKTTKDLNSKLHHYF